MLLMKRKKVQRKFLRYVLFINLLVLIPLFLRKKPIKDWVIVYLYNALTNGIIDQVLTKLKIVRYPVRFFPKLFNVHLLFDLLIYPTFTILYNQITYKDTILPIIYKLFLLTLPPFFIEFWAERKTDLVHWSKKWKWYHTYFSIILKSLTTRMFIGVIRAMDH